MGYRRGRLSRDHFKRLSFEHKPDGDFVRPFIGKNNCTWFALDGEKKSAHVVDHGDGYSGSVLGLCDHLQDNEAVLVVSEPEWGRWIRLNLKPGADEEARGDVGFPIAMIGQMAFRLIVQGKVSVVDKRPEGIVDPRMEYLSFPELMIRLAQSSN